MLIEFMVFVLLVGIMMYLLIKNLEWQFKFEKRLKDEIEKKEKEIREDAVKRSSAVLLGKSIEKLVPISKDIEFDPRDMKWLGDPVDYIVFDGLSKNDTKQVVFLEIKTGSSDLSKRQKQIKKLIEKKKVKWKEIKI